MTQALPIVFNATVDHYPVGVFQGSASVWVNPQGTQSPPTHRTDYRETTNNWALVLDRKDPSKPALFSQKLSSCTDVPANLAKLMTPDYLLFYMATGTVNFMPQGPQFKWLKANGGGAQLERVETLAVLHGSSMTASILYTLVSIPGSNLPGIENTTTGQYGHSTYPDTTVRLYTSGVSSSVMSLIPSADGYVPMEIG